MTAAAAPLQMTAVGGASSGTQPRPPFGFARPHAHRRCSLLHLRTTGSPCSGRICCSQRLLHHPRARRSSMDPLQWSPGVPVLQIVDIDPESRSPRHGRVGQAWGTESMWLRRPSSAGVPALMFVDRDPDRSPSQPCPTQNGYRRRRRRSAARHG
jgi:hypothetical protein